MPVRSTGRRRERRGHEDQRKIAETAIELREADVVAHREADAAARQLDRDGLGAGFDRAPLVVALVVTGEGEQVDLVVARDTPAVGTVDEARAAHASGIAQGDGNGAADEPDAVPLRLGGEKCLLRALPVRLAHGHLVRRPRCRRCRNTRAARRGARRLPRPAPISGRRNGEIRRDVAARDHLHGGNAERRAVLRAAPASDAGLRAPRRTVIASFLRPSGRARRSPSRFRRA